LSKDVQNQLDDFYRKSSEKKGKIDAILGFREALKVESESSEEVSTLGKKMDSECFKPSVDLPWYQKVVKIFLDYTYLAYDFISGYVKVVYDYIFSKKTEELKEEKKLKAEKEREEKLAQIKEETQGMLKEYEEKLRLVELEKERAEKEREKAEREREKAEREREKAEREKAEREKEERELKMTCQEAVINRFADISTKALISINKLNFSECNQLLKELNKMDKVGDCEALLEKLSARKG